MPGRILVVDDEPFVRSLVRDALRLDGFTVETAEGGEAALASLARENFDLLFTDALMPGMGGLELLRRVRQSHPGLPVVVLTAHSTEHDVSEFILAGASDYLLKPFQIDDLLAVARKWCPGDGGGSAREV